MRWLFKLIRWFYEILSTAWLLFFAFWAFAISLNKYRDPSVIDCDRDGEAAVMLALIVIMISTLVIWGINLMIKKFGEGRIFWMSGSVSAILAIASIARYIELTLYNQQLAAVCR